MFSRRTWPEIEIRQVKHAWNGIWKKSHVSDIFPFHTSCTSLRISIASLLLPFHTAYLFCLLYFSVRFSYLHLKINHLCIFIVTSMYSYCIFMYLHLAIWHSSATLTEVFPCFFLSCEANAIIEPAKMVHSPQTSKHVVLFRVLLVLCRSVYRLCLNVYCIAATGGLPNCS